MEEKLPTNGEHAAFIKAKTDELIAYVRDNRSGSYDAQRFTALAINNYEQAAEWAIKALSS